MPPASTCARWPRPPVHRPSGQLGRLAMLGTAVGPWHPHSSRTFAEATPRPPERPTSSMGGLRRRSSGRRWGSRGSRGDRCEAPRSCSKTDFLGSSNRRWDTKEDSLSRLLTRPERAPAGDCHMTLQGIPTRRVGTDGTARRTRPPRHGRARPRRGRGTCTSSNSSSSSSNRSWPCNADCAGSASASWVDNRCQKALVMQHGHESRAR
mmetsp:Transcript_75007/g.195400  ORF Transcript_75007/g.195400 Transcript_75007/m.195400 type:complete len:208 (+) Transcript_75007:477-1100(+)